MKTNLTVINNGIIYIIQHNQEKEKEVKRVKRRKRAYSGKTIRHDIIGIKWLLLRDGYKVSESVKSKNDCNILSSRLNSHKKYH